MIIIAAEAAMQALVTGQIPGQDLAIEILADRDRLLEQIYLRDTKIAEQQYALAAAAKMIDCLSASAQRPQQ
jgi:hypothetical protein